MLLVTLTKGQYPLGSRKAWAPGSADQDIVADGTIFQGTQKSRTQCYSGNEKYLQQAVLCDRECMKDTRAVAKASGRPDDFRDSEKYCNGPWYCSRTTICELYRKEGPETSFQRPCTSVFGCANHSQCFPTDDEMQRMKIQMPGNTDWSVQENTFKIRDDGFTLYYGGFKLTTTCCVNNRGKEKRYRLFINNPCNSALSFASSGLLGVVLAAATTMVLLLLRSSSSIT